MRLDQYYMWIDRSKAIKQHTHTGSLSLQIKFGSIKVPCSTHLTEEIKKTNEQELGISSIKVSSKQCLEEALATNYFQE